MTRGWGIVATLFVTLFLVFGGGFNTAGVFFTPLLDHFGWSRAQLSLLQTALALSAGLGTPLVGLLLDRIEARMVIAAGAALSGAGFIVASRADAFGTMLAAYTLLGVGLSASTLLPCSLVVANWFGARRGLALGLTMAGTSAGGMAMTLVASRAIADAGWRAAYVTLALPMLLVVVPLVIITVRTRPRAAAAVTVAQAADALPGLEVGDALRARSFWLIAVAQFAFAFAVTGTNLHGVPYLIGIGYSAARAAEMLSLIFGIAALGKLVMGTLADRIGARRALVVNFALTAIGMLTLLRADDAVMATVFIAIYGLAVGAPLTLVPLLIAESLGLKRFGALSGLAGLFNVLGAAIGPVVAGRVFDATGSYTGAFQLFTVALAAGAAATFGCVSLGVHTERARSDAILRQATPTP